jgi:hypothetical protein
MEIYFEKIATRIISKHELVVANNTYQIAELEFYLNREDHPDIFTHSHEDQLSRDQWYFHKTGSGYKGGTYKGLDLTFEEGYGGILLRAP